eukprot:TRINITY_DN1483_c0_g1_i12.p1 TRINITY_DN1483_c0_g1~~TRINITY_DN1483_c0_g1_i12.p1  ORF type:complete len:529 (-),score=39.22 TRINITY_DN1483_c0_g1_i12:1725-3311(-)
MLVYLFSLFLSVYMQPASLPCPCNDNPPKDYLHTCKEYANWGVCEMQWKGEYCECACGTCSNTTGSLVIPQEEATQQPKVKSASVPQLNIRQVSDVSCAELLQNFALLGTNEQSAMYGEEPIKECMVQYDICQGSYVLNTCCSPEHSCDLQVLGITAPTFDFYAFIDESGSDCRCPFKDDTDALPPSEQLWEQVTPIRPQMRPNGSSYQYNYGAEWIGPVSDVMHFFENRIPTRGEWFDVLDWSNQTVQCQNNASTTTCMSCSMNMPRFALDKKIAPFGVSDMYWAYPLPGATCGMCFKVFLKQGEFTDVCNTTSFKQYPQCPGNGNASYADYASQNWAWNSPIYKDEVTSEPYLLGINVEWYDLFVPLPYGISYLTKGKSPIGMGSWPIEIQAVECPVGNYTMEFAFIDLKDDTENKKNKKLQVAGNSMPITAIEIKLVDGNWHQMFLSGDKSDGIYPDGDGHWMSPWTVWHNLDLPVDLKIFCAGSSVPVYEYNIIPQNIMCQYQDTQCKRMISSVQCPSPNIQSV